MKFSFKYAYYSTNKYGHDDKSLQYLHDYVLCPISYVNFFQYIIFLEQIADRSFLSFLSILKSEWRMLPDFYIW